MESVNPATGETLARYRDTTPTECRARLDRAGAAQRAWSGASLADRAGVLRSVAGRLGKEREALARLMTLEMGKPIAQARAEVDKCAWVCEHYAQHAAAYLADEPVDTDASRSFVTFRPLGVILAVMPWNFPLWQVFRCAAPALVAGNAVVLKHASNVPGCALAIEEVFLHGGLPDGLFASLLVPAAAMGELIEHPLVRGVSLTGSTPAGAAIAARAGAALKKTVLELGGSDPYVVLADADVAAAAETCAVARLVNNGQSCIAAKRFVVVPEVRAAFERAFTERMAARSVGDPLDPATDVGPMARQDLRDELHDQVTRSVSEGARVLLGGSVPARPGAFYPPTVLADVRPGMAAFEEELFGPVAAVVPAENEVDAVRLANAGSFGLGAAVFSRDAARAERIAADDLEAGSCFVNSFVRSDPRLPFGGIRDSGYGRELGRFGILEWVNVKTVYVA